MLTFRISENLNYNSVNYTQLKKNLKKISILF